MKSSSIDDDDEIISLTNFVEKSEEYILKSTFDVKQQELNFKNFINLFCQTYLFNENSMKFCFDTDFVSFLISFFAKKQFYLTSSIFYIKNNQRMICRRIIAKKMKSDLYTEIFIRMKIFNDFFVTFTKKFHILNDVSCSIVVKTDFMKSFNIKSNWKSKNLFDFVIIQRLHVVEMKITLFLIFKKLFLFISTLSKLFIKMKSFKTFRKKSINVYITSFHILESKHDKNVQVTHKFLTKKTYQYNSWFYENSKTNSFATRINAMIFDDINNVFLTNFDDDLIKIKIEQFLNILIQERIDDFIEININVIKILLKKSEVEIKKDDIISNSSISLKLKNLFNRKMSFDVNVTNFFAFETSKNEKNLNSDINDHWKSKYKKKIRSILLKHKSFFRSDLDQFNDEILMFVSFRNEKNIKRLKQSSYFMSFKDKKTMNEILNFFMTNNQIQKISFEIINSATSFAFVIWRKKKSRIMINLKRINIRLYSNVYSLLKQNTILFFFDDSIVFSSIDFIKEFFQQSIDSKNYWKTTFVSQHRELEWLTMSSMNSNNISKFFQHRMKRF
jgi:hypothetical protein